MMSGRGKSDSVMVAEKLMNVGLAAIAVPNLHSQGRDG